MKWYYWVPICWIGLDVFIVACLWVLRLLHSRRIARKNIRPVMGPSSVVPMPSAAPFSPQSSGSQRAF
jgi:hypothetical protein